jgi:hypothetical protein
VQLQDRAASKHARQLVRGNPAGTHFVECDCRVLADATGHGVETDHAAILRDAHDTRVAGRVATNQLDPRR